MKKRIEINKNIPDQIDFAAESLARILIEQVLSTKSYQTVIGVEKKYEKSD